MPYEIPKREDMIKPEPTPEQDLVEKALFDSGISELELNLHTVEANNVMAKEGMLQRVKLADDKEAQKEIEHQIEENNQSIARGHAQLLESYKNLARSIDRKLIPALRQHIISGLPKVLTPDERKDVLGALRSR